MDNSSQWRMAAAQHVFSIAPAQVKEHENPGPLSLPAVGPDAITLDRFWRRIAELTKRYHDSKDRWIGCHEIREWNKSNRKACDNCVNSKTSRVCIIDEDQTSCRPCRTIKIGCDRKQRFLFAMTKDNFFPHYDVFMRVFQSKERSSSRGYNRIPSGRPRLQSKTLHSDSQKDGANSRALNGKCSGPTSAQDAGERTAMLAEFIARTVAPLLLKIQDRHRQGVDQDELSYIQTMVEDRLLESWEQINTIVYGERTDDPS